MLKTLDTFSEKPVLASDTSQAVVIVLVEPRIPQNFGNISRLAACTGCPLIIIGDTGFSLLDKDVKRSGLDYLDDVDLRRYRDLPDVAEDFPHHDVAYLSSHAKQLYTDIPANKPMLLVFGSESTGLPKALLAARPEACYTIPMQAERRSLNLSSSVSLVVYDALRQRYHW
jgi:tRNA (cytidine/uridine-2'-O-)-methyltransferase